MNIYRQNPGLKPINLDWNMTLLAHTIIQVNSVYIRYPSEVEKSLATKIERAKNGCKPGQRAVIYLSSEEQKRMRQHNTDYCCMLTGNILALEELPGSSLVNGLETYILATKLQMLFSS